ncbi:MAG: hypothetical protein VX998_07395 [Candidatus Thermoplasmatota archaeon]|nr:hypothetical protein [Candidatus Thermoplasmatota archaeon]
MQALVSWLDTVNVNHANKYGLDKLVWCEGSRRQDRQTRAFFYNDTQTKQRKLCRNATHALKIVFDLTGCDFFSDMSSATFTSTTHESQHIPTDIPTVYI